MLLVKLILLYLVIKTIYYAIALGVFIHEKCAGKGFRKSFEVAFMWPIDFVCWTKKTFSQSFTFSHE